MKDMSTAKRFAVQMDAKVKRLEAQLAERDVKIEKLKALVSSYRTSEEIDAILGIKS